MSKSSGMKKGNMKEWKSWLVLLTMFLGFVSCTAFGQDAAAARIAERLKVPVATLPLLKDAPALDAAPDFKAWAGPLAFQNLTGFGQKPPVETKGYLATDGKNIYLAVRCEDPAAKEIASAPVPLDGNVWASDSAEFMLLPGHDPDQAYYHFAVNPAGSLYDAAGADKTWNSGAKVLTSIDAKGWLAVLQMPLTAIGLNDGELPALWRVNLHRYRPARGGNPELDLAWSPTRSTQNHVPDRFGLVWYNTGKPLDADTIIKELTMKAGIDLGEPVIVAQAAANFTDWGPYQFPGLVRLPDGRIQLSFQVEADSATSYGLPPARAISSDEGQTWTLLPREVAGKGSAAAWSAPLELPNGDRLGIKSLASLKSSDIKLPANPLGLHASYGNIHTYYRPEDLPPECRDGWWLYRQAAGAKEPVEEKAVVRLPGELRYVVEGVLPRPWTPGHRMRLAPDGSIWAFGEDVRMVGGELRGKPAITFLRSTDNGRSFDFLSEIPYTPDPAADPKAADRDGFTEPGINFMADGSVICLMRTTDGNGPGPLYLSRSTDNGRIWSKPVVFDDLGVWPQLLTLKNGVTLSAYGRPGLFVRASTDPAGRKWGKRAMVVHNSYTCSYSALLPLSDDTALLAYSDFKVPGPDGTPRKTILVRTVKTAELTPQVAARAGAKTLPAFVISQRTTQPLLKSEMPWENRYMNFFNVIRDERGWHMWYHAYDHSYKDDNDAYLCYAFSKDGLAWTRPELGLVEYEGSKKNNILIAGRATGGLHGGTVFLDPQAPAAERYKLVFTRGEIIDGHLVWVVRGAVSADGLNWRILPEPLLKKNSDTQTVCFRDGDVYRLYVRMWSGNNFTGKRMVGYSESRTFGAFPVPEAIFAPAPQDPEDLHFYNSAATRLKDDLYVIFPSAFFTGDQTVRPYLAASRDGRHFERAANKEFLALGATDSFDGKSIYVVPGAIPGDKPGTWWMYYIGLNIGHDGKQERAGAYGRFLLEIKERK
jgi:hypothetical protein